MGEKKTFGFKSQLEVGNVGEKLFLKKYKGATKSEDLKYDFLLDNETVELKTDTYPMEKTENLFMEYYSSIEDKKFGGPWRAANDKVDYFVYLYLADKKFFWFDTKTLIKHLDKVTPTMRGKTVMNRGYTSLGFAVSRESVEHLVLKIDKA